MLNITIKQENDALIIALKGRFDGLGASGFDKEIQAIVPSESNRNMVLDLQGVDYLSSAGIRSLVILAKKMKKYRGKIYLASLQSNVKNVLDISGLLILFDVTKDVTEALERIQEIQQKRETTDVISLSGSSYQLHFDPKNLNSLEIWSQLKTKEKPIFTKGDLYSLSLEDLGISFGIGGLGAEPTSNLESLGMFLSIGGTAGVLPADGHQQIDYLTLNDPKEAFAHIADAISFGGHPAGSVIIEEGKSISLSKLLEEIYRGLVEQIGLPDTKGPLGFAFLIFADEGHTGGLYKTLADLQERTAHQVAISKEQSIVGVGLYRPDGWEIDSLLTPFLHRRNIEIKESFLIGNALLLAREIEEYNAIDAMDPTRLFEGHMEFPDTLIELNEDITIQKGKVWIYYPESIRLGEEKLLKIELTATTDPLPKEWEIIARRLYAKHSKVVMQLLKGGFSPAKPFRVTSYDQSNRRTLPTVLKVGPKEEVDREYSAYKKYVERYILNNSTSIMGLSEFGSSKGICYNFVGISGPDSQLTWLTHLYKQKPIEDLLPLFDRIFTEILKPWYGQPQWKSIQLYKEHSPLGLFPNIINDAETVLGISADEELLYCPYLDIKLPNPYHFLKHIYPARLHKERLWYSGINHGDLNMQNILLDERDNIYIIDFSETGIRNIVSDFARLEPIIRIELTRLNDENDLSALLEFELGLSKAKTLREDLLFTYSGDDPMVHKAFPLISRLRKHASRVVIFEDDITPYLLAILQWVFPIVSFISADTETKKLGAYSAAFMVKQILDLEK